MTTPLMHTELPGLRLKSRGKVRDIYEMGSALLIVSTDRISAFDHVLPNGIPEKGKVLNQITLFWMEKSKELVRNHLREHHAESFPEPLLQHAPMLHGRAVLVERLKMLPIECVVRGYLSGSGYKDYKKTGAVCGIKLPPGLREADRLPEPVFTPSTKAETGHDENISFDKAVQMVGGETVEAARDLSLKIYALGCRHAESRGIIIADTKFEFGHDAKGLVLADEVLTPDSSRFWPADSYKPGQPQASLDKQYVRDYLESIHWDKNPPAPKLPDDIVAGTSQRYVEIFRRLSGRELD
jgi:phosphoribosylaminoimidazole-succinocarboxamide synthase